MAELAAMMVGREVLLTVEKGISKPAETVLAVENLIVHGKTNHLAVKGVSFEVHAGEIYGIAGVQGNGQTELVEALTGLKKSSGGIVRLLGEDVTNQSSRTLTQRGLAHIPEDRHKHGLILPFPIDTNLILETYYQEPFSKHGWINLESIQKHAEQLVREFDVRTPSIFTTVSSLSGGNQQKVIVAREMSRSIKVLVINQPTRGLDVGSIEFIHKRIIEARDRGVAVLLISAELDEILSLSDRIGVMYGGKIVKELPAEQASREILGYYMAGLQAEAGD